LGYVFVMGMEPPAHWSRWGRWAVVSPWRFALIFALVVGIGAGIPTIQKHGDLVNVLLAAVAGGLVGLVFYRMSYQKYKR